MLGLVTCGDLEGAGGFAAGFGGVGLGGGEVDEGLRGFGLGGGADEVGPGLGDEAEGLEPLGDPGVGEEVAELEDGEGVALAKGLGGEVGPVEVLDELGG